MATVLVATYSGCRAFAESGETGRELAGREVNFLAREPSDSCIAIIEGKEIWRRDVGGSWSLISNSAMPLQSLTSVDSVVFAGGLDEAVMLRVGRGEVERLKGFDVTPGREEWFAGGPPLGVRSLAVSADGAAILAGVHVGGVARSVDGGENWTPTMPVMFDVHEVCAHPFSPGFAAAACAVGLALSHDAGITWRVLSEGLDVPYSLAVAVLEDEVLFSVQDGPFAARSQIWRWRNGTDRVELVRDGLPEWLEGRLDTGHIAVGAGRAAVVDGGGNLWLSRAGSSGWERIAGDLRYVFGAVILG
jgi:hypothetical protein